MEKKNVWDFLTFTLSLPASEGSSIYSSCASTSGAQSVVTSFIPHLVLTIFMVLPLLIYAT